MLPDDVDYLGEPYRKTEQELESVHSRLEQAGVRPFPYPFSTGVALVSDIDGSNRQHFDTCIDYLVQHLGLDFGDSVRLFHMPNKHRGSGLAVCPFDAFEPPFSSNDRPIDTYLSAFEVLDHYLRGNFDHIHGIAGLSPKALQIQVPSAATIKPLAISIPAALSDKEVKPVGLFRATGLPIMGVAFAVSRESLAQEFQVTLRLRDGQAIPLTAIDLAQHQPESTPWRPRFSHDPLRHSLMFELDESEFAPPLADDIKQLIIDSPCLGSDDLIESVFLLSCHRPVLHRLVAMLAKDFAFRPNLYTDHGALYFYNRYSGQHHKERVEQRFDQRESIATTFALYSAARNTDVYCSAMGDDPESFAYLLPELRQQFGLRFINPAGASGMLGDSIQLSEAVLPVTARDGTSIYFARRLTLALPDIEEAEHPLLKDTGVQSIAERIGHLLDCVAEKPNQLWPIYTHIGNMTKIHNEGDEVPQFEDFLRKPEFARLQNHVANITGDVPLEERVWFTRASMLYDYDLNIRNIATHLERPNPNTICIERWFDPILQCMMPQHPAQLNGISLYVEEACSAKVLLDGEPINQLLRNPADHSGRESVTIIGYGCVYSVMELLRNQPTPKKSALWSKLERFARSAAQLPLFNAEQLKSGDDVESQWIDDPLSDDQNKVLELGLKSDGVHAFLCPPLHVQPSGSQYFAYEVFASGDAPKFGVLIETSTEGRFFFGERELHDSVGEITASYDTPSLLNQNNQVFVPFHSLNWAEGSAPGGAFPSHAPARIYFLLSGQSKQRVVVRRIEYVRPSTNSPTTSSHTLGGRVVDPDLDGLLVSLRIRGSEQEFQYEQSLSESQGYFLFFAVPHGAVANVIVKHPDYGVLSEVYTTVERSSLALRLRLPKRGRRRHKNGARLT